MASFKWTFGDDTTGMVGTIRQRLLANVEDGVDPGHWSTVQIKQRLNSKVNVWAAKLASLGSQTFTKTYEFSLSAAPYEETLPEDFMAAWQLYRIQSPNGRKIPVALISPREEASHAYPPFSVAIDVNSPRKYRAFIAGDTLTFVSTSSTDASLVGDYELEYYYYPSEMTDAAHKTPFPHQLDEVLLADVTSSLAMDGGDMGLASFWAQQQKDLYRDFYSLYVRRDKVSPRRISDKMQYGGNKRPLWTH
jgi:hypothetical protein